MTPRREGSTYIPNDTPLYTLDIRSKMAAR